MREIEDYDNYMRQVRETGDYLWKYHEDKSVRNHELAEEHKRDQLIEVRYLLQKANYPREYIEDHVDRKIHIKAEYMEHPELLINQLKTKLK